MLYAVLGDIHGNIEALQGVLADAREQGVERFLCAGDVVGYGASPRECLAAVAELGPIVVAGNHDWAALGKVNIDYFNADARDSIEWTREQLTQSDLDYLDSLELVCTADGATVVHSTPFSPEYFDYIQTLYDVQLAFQHMETSFCFVAHSHVPVMFLDTDPVEYFLKDEFQLPPERRSIINVGSVGQPRDLDPRACYALYDSVELSITLRRVEYDLHRASERMITAGLPMTNSTRIVLGR